MQPAVLAAVVTGAVALIVAFWTAWWTSRLQSRLSEAKADSDRRLAELNADSAKRLKDIESAGSRALEEHKHELARAAKRQDQRTEQQAVLDLYRKPLIAAADDLGHRINNIRLEYFFDRYLGGDGQRQQLALRTTLFRFAKYFGWIEVLYRRVTFLDFGNEADTRTVALALRNVGGDFASDNPDTHLMLWREEQRAIGGLMQLPDGAPGVIGFDEFDRLYDERFAAWFARFSADLQRQGAKDSPRLVKVQEHLGELVLALDRERLHDPTRSWWLRNTTAFRQSSDGADR